MHLLRHDQAGDGIRRAGHQRERALHRPRALRPTVPVRDLAAAPPARLVVRKYAEPDLRGSPAPTKRHPAAHRRRARPPGLQLRHPHLAHRRRDQRPLPLAYRDDAQAHQGRGLRMGYWLLHLPHAARGVRALPAGGAGPPLNGILALLLLFRGHERTEVKWQTARADGTFANQSVVRDAEESMARMRRWLRFLVIVGLLFVGLAVVGLIFGGIKSGSVLVLDLSGDIEEEKAQGAWGATLGSDITVLHQILDAIDAAKSDARITGLVVKISSPGGNWAKLAEIREPLIG